MIFTGNVPPHPYTFNVTGLTASTTYTYNVLGWLNCVIVGNVVQLVSGQSINFGGFALNTASVNPTNDKAAGVQKVSTSVVTTKSSSAVTFTITAGTAPVSAIKIKGTCLKNVKSSKVAVTKPIKKVKGVKAGQNTVTVVFSKKFVSCVFTKIKAVYPVRTGDGKNSFTKKGVKTGHMTVNFK